MLELNQVCKEYCDGSRQVTAVAIDSLIIKAGEQVALVGPSGSGKTTLLHLISGLLIPTRGEITFDNVAVSAMPEVWRDAWRARTIGYVFQKLNLLNSLSILDNLLVAMSFAHVIPRKEQQQWASRLLTQVGLGDRLHSRPQQLSMGEQQRVAVARAVVNKPGIILADEPTASLDQENGLRVLALLCQMAEEANSILLVSTHDTQIMKRFERVFPLLQPERQVVISAACNSLA